MTQYAFSVLRLTLNLQNLFLVIFAPFVAKFTFAHFPHSLGRFPPFWD